MKELRPATKDVYKRQVPGHKGRFVCGYVDSVPVVIMQGRVHYYEGYPTTDVVLPTRLMGTMGAKDVYKRQKLTCEY